MRFLAVTTAIIMTKGSSVAIISSNSPRAPSKEIAGVISLRGNMEEMALP